MPESTEKRQGVAKYDNPYVSPNIPRAGNAFSRAFGGALLYMLGWTLTGQFANEKKAVLIAAPHKSILDFFLAMSAMLKVGFRFSWMMKQEAFFFPFKRLLKKLGGVPIDRSKSNDVIKQTTEWFNAQQSAWLGLTPEGTRSEVKTFKRGYLRIAYAAEVPVFLVAVDWANKQVVLDRIWPLTGDIERDNSDIQAYYETTYQGSKAEQ